jgi:hypothetical protein
VTYTLTGPGGFSHTDSMDFDPVQAISFPIDNVPAGSGYNLAIQASAGDGGTEMCTASAPVDVTAQSSVPVQMTAQCTGVPYMPSGFGTLDVWANLPGGVTVTSAGFVVSGPGGVEAQKTVDVTGAGLHFTLQNVPSGMGEVISLTAVSTDGTQTCNTSTQFDIAAGQTKVVMLTFQCGASPAGGDQ